MDKNECLDFAGIPGGLGHDEKEEVCQSCTDTEECKTLTESRGKKETKKPKKENTGEHKFMKGSIRGQVADWLSEGMETPRIVMELTKNFGMMEKNAFRKISAVKKLLGK
jgi:hypothetical protein